MGCIEDNHICDPSKALNFKKAPEFVGKWYRHPDGEPSAHQVLEIDEVSAFGAENYGCGFGKWPLVVGDYNANYLASNPTLNPIGGHKKLVGGIVRPKLFYFRWVNDQEESRELWGELVEPGKMLYQDSSDDVLVLYKRPTASE